MSRLPARRRSSSSICRRATALKASVYVTTASVSLARGGRTFLDEFDDGWKLSAAGCVASAPDLPYDCELEG
jgi:hypothetical protein